MKGSAANRVTRKGTQSPSPENWRDSILPELPGEILPDSTRFPMCALRTIEVEKAEAHRRSAEFLRGAIEHARRSALDPEDPAGHRARFIPYFDGKPARANFERIKAGQQHQQIVAVFERRGPLAAAQKVFNLFEKQLGSGIENRHCPLRMVFSHLTIPRTERRRRSDITLVLVLKKFSTVRSTRLDCANSSHAA